MRQMEKNGLNKKKYNRVNRKKRLWGRKRTIVSSEKYNEVRRKKEERNL